MHEELNRRALLMRWLAREPSARVPVRAACAKDVLFFVGNFGWGYDPRTPERDEYPMILFGDQGRVTQALASPHSGRLLLEKSRDQGASVIATHAAVHGWAFHRGYSWGMLTRVGKDLDDGTYNSLFGKIDWLLEKLPPFLIPPNSWERKRGHNPMFKNHMTGAIIKGGATTSGSLRGQRFRKVFVDEAAHIQCLGKMMPSLQGLTNNLILGSSVNGPANTFAHIRHGRGTYVSQPYGTPGALPGSWSILRLHHSQDPRKGPAWEAEMRRGMDAIDFDQEYDIKYNTTTRWRVLHELDIDRLTYAPDEWESLWRNHGWGAAQKVGWDFGSGTSLTGYAAALYFEAIDTLIFYKYNAWRERHWMDITREYAQDGWFTRHNQKGIKPDVLTGDNSGGNRDSSQESWLSNFEGQGINIDGRVIWHFSKTVQLANQKIRQGKVLFAPDISVRRSPALPSLGESLASWKYKVHGEGDDARSDGKPDKNIYSHLSDAMLYVIDETWGANEIDIRTLPTHTSQPAPYTEGFR